MLMKFSLSQFIYVIRQIHLSSLLLSFEKNTYIIMPSSQQYYDLKQKDGKIMNRAIIVNYSISAIKFRMKKSPELFTVHFYLFKELIQITLKICHRKL